MLQMKGIVLGSPASSAANGSKVALRELRPASGASPARVFYAFDPERAAVVLCGGSKNDPGDVYETAIRLAEAEFAAHCAAVTARKVAEAEAAKAKSKKKKQKK